MAEETPTPAGPEPDETAVPSTPDAPVAGSEGLEPQVASAAADPEPETPKAPRARAAAPKAKAADQPKAAADKPKAAAPKAKAKPVAADRGKAKPPAPRRTKRGSEITPGAQPPVVRAQAKYVRTSARKARLVCDHIRGKSVVEARAILAFAPRAVAADWAKLLNSAVANAEHNHELIGEDLRVLAAFADEGPTLKRFRPRAMGRATPIRKRTSHLTITLTPKE
jgi:ribosomal protein L22